MYYRMHTRGFKSTVPVTAPAGRCVQLHGVVAWEMTQSRETTLEDGPGAPLIHCAQSLLWDRYRSENVLLLPLYFCCCCCTLWVNRAAPSAAHFRSPEQSLLHLTAAHPELLSLWAEQAAAAMLDDPAFAAEYLAHVATASS